MKGTALLLLCAIAAQAAQSQLTVRGTVCHCDAGQADSVCSQNGSDNELIVHENCNQFYKCSNGKAFAYFCPGITLYNPLAEICDWPENVQCGDRPIVSPDSGDSGNEDCDQESNATTEGNDNGSGGTCNCNPEEAPALCAAEGSDGVLVVHQNCNQFYKCDHGVPVTLNCPPGLLYNPYTEQCDWPNNVDCGDRPIVEIDNGGDNDNDEDCEDNDNGENGTDNEGTCNCNPAEAPAICAADGSSGILVAHENCNQFYKCDHGVPVTQNCPSGLLYNAYKEQCDWPANVDCGDRPIVEIDCGDIGDNGSGGGSGDNDSGGGSTGGNSNEDNGGTCNCNPNEAPEICAVDGSDGTLIAHENCNQYYSCVHGAPVTMNCPAGLVYNPYIERCDWPYNVDCGDKPIVEIDGGGNGDNGGEDNGSGGGNGDNGSGDNGGTCNCNPDEAPGICAVDGSSGILVAHENCNQFYKCDHGVPVTQNCPSGLLYNPYKEQCDWAANVDCGDRPIVEIDCGDNGDNGSGGGSGDNGSGGGSTGGNSNEDNGGTCNCNPNEAPEICAVDGSDGTLIAHENCNQYYSCVHGAPVTMNCPAGLVYNPYIERCDWPYNVDCGDKPIVEIDGGGNGDNGSEDNGSGGGNGDNGSGDNGGTCNCNPGEAPSICGAPGSDGTLVAHENCNQFYKCDHGVPVTQNCPSGLLYNPYKEQCDWPANVDCGDRPIVEIDGGDDGDNGSGGGSGDNGSGGGSTGGNSNEDNGGTCNCNPNEAPEICAVDGSDGTLIAHENCNQYYSCVHGAPVTMNCPAGLVYNPYIERCDWPYNVDCGDKPIVEIDGGGNGDNGSEDNGSGGGNGDNGSGDNGGTCNCNPGEAPSICGAPGSDGTLVAHENCNQFYKCDHGVPVTQNCPSGLLYNPYKEQCDWPANVDCGDRPIVEIDGGDDGDNGSGGGSGDNGSGGGSTGGNSNEDNGGTCNCNPNEAPEICAVDGSEGILIAHENCNQYYSCVHGAPVTMNCPAGLVYNPYIERCDWPYNVDCGDKPIVDIDSGGNGDNGGEDNGSGDGNGDNGSGDNGGTCNCNPGEAPSICGAPGSDGTLVAHENCNQFYKCDHGVPVTQNCPSGLLYNPYKEQCDWAANVDCGDRPIVEIDCGDNGDNGSGGGSGDNGSGGGSTGGNSNEDNGGTCNCNPNEAPEICAVDGSDGTLIAHENCNQYYSCVHGAPVTMNCPAGLVYNPYIERCDWPANVDCGDRPIVEIDGGDNEDTDNGGDGNGGDDNGSSDNGGGTCNCNPSEAPGICGAPGSDGTLVAHENCNQFYKCAHGVPVALYCNDKLLYNPHTERCDWPADVDCGDRPIVEIDGGDNEDTDNGGDGNGGDDNGSSDNGGGTCNCNPSEAPGICGAPGSDGTLVAHENCNQFYKCAHGVPVALYCNDKLLYNPHTERCDWPAEVDCGDRPIVEIDGGDNEDTDNGGDGNGGDDNGSSDNGGGTCNCNPSEAPGICGAPGSDGTLVAHENCNQFYKCAHGVPVALYCNDKLLYNPHTERCDWPAEVDCGDRPIVEIDGGDNEDTDNGGDGNGGDDNGSSDNGGGTCNCNPSEAPGICGAPGSDGTLVAHENCNQFYKCAHGVPVALYCNDKLLYNPHTERCDWPADVDCGDRPIVEIDGGDNEDTDNGGDSNGGDDNGSSDNGGGTCNCNPSEAPGICGAPGSDGTLVAHENCNQFYKCAHGVPVALYCNDKLLYNPHTERCDWPADVDCGDRPIVEIDGGDNEDTDNGGDSNGGDDNGSSDNGGGTCNCNPSEAPGICGAPGSDGTLVAHENCNQFYKCAHGVPVALYCNDKLLYNPHTERCDWPADVDCGDRPIVEIDGGDNEDTDNGGDGNGGDDNGSSDNGGGTCNCNPSEAPGICGAPGSDGTLVAHENCNQFYKCAYGVPVALYCNENLLYNPYTERCDWPANVECENRNIVEDVNESIDHESSDISNTSCDCSDEVTSICAAGGSHGLHIVHENCNQFYVCNHGIPVCQFCPVGTLFNHITLRCDWPDRVECGDRPIVEYEGGNNNDTDSGDEDNNSGENPGTCNCNPNEAPSICSAPGSDSTQIAHENCNQYYICAHGVPVAMFCPANLLYNPFIGRCNWPSLVDCGDRPIVEVEEGGNDSDEDGDVGPGGDPEFGCHPNEAHAVCTLPTANGALLCHENCNRFYVCTNGAPLAMDCPANLLYNPKIKDCDWPINVNCGDRVISESGGNDGPCACDAREAPSVCAGSESNGKLIAHENCNQYYVCFEGVPVARSCPRMLFYEPHTEQCLWPTSVNCEGRAFSTYSSLNKHVQARRGYF